MTTPKQQDSHVSKDKQTPNTTTKQENQPSLKCPRCDSPNTKFCYFNNYSLTQPRYFCKTCRRYWTKGGALRNVPIGGGCRKNKKLRSSASASSSCRFPGVDPKDFSTTGSSSLDFGGGFKLFHRLSPAMDFNLGGLSFPRLNSSPTTSGGIVYGGHFSSLGDHHFHGGPNSSSGNITVSTTPSTTHSPSGFSLDLLSAGSSGTGGSLLGFNSQPFSSLPGGLLSTPDAIQEVGNGGGSMSVHTSLASSIESLSSINQDLHWKLQQQRLGMLLGGGGGGGGGEDQHKDHLANPNQPSASQVEKLQPILFQNLEISSKHDLEIGSINARRGGGGGSSGEMATEWFFGNSYGQVGASASTPTNSNGNENASNWNNGVQPSWGDHHLHQYNSLP